MLAPDEGDYRRRRCLRRGSGLLSQVPDVLVATIRCDSPTRSLNLNSVHYCLLCRPHLSSPNEADSLAPVVALLVWAACVGRPRSGMVRPGAAHTPSIPLSASVSRTHFHTNTTHCQSNSALTHSSSLKQRTDFRRLRTS